MSVTEIIVRLLVAALLISYLVSKHRQRVRNRPAEPLDPAVWTGTGIDTSRLVPRIELVRRDYLAGARSPMHDIWYRRGLLAWMRQAVAQLSFFQKRKSKDDAQGHAV